MDICISQQWKTIEGRGSMVVHVILVERIQEVLQSPPLLYIRL